MDRPIEKKNRFKNKKAILYSSIGVALVASLFVISGNIDKQVVDADKIRVGEVVRGDLVVEVVGSGRVQAKNVEWIVPKIAGEISEIYVEAGDWVNAGDQVLAMINDEISVELAEKESRYAEAQAIAAAREFELDAQQMGYEKDYLQAKYNFESKEALYNAQSELMDEENPPISKMLYIQTEIEKNQLEHLHKVAEKRMQNFAKLKEAQQVEIRSRLNVAKLERDRFAQRVNDLVLVAKTSGVIQDFDFKAGQRLTVGQQVAKIIDASKVFVRLEVPALDAYKLKKDQPAVVDINRKKVDGIVERIDPNIKGTIIEVDIALVGDAQDARIDMFVNGSITVNKIHNTLYVNKPSMAVEVSKSKLYRINDKDQSAQLVSVDTGVFSSHHVQIVAGLNEGDKIILSEPAGIKNQETFYIR